MNVLVATMMNERYRGIANVSLPNMLEYCKHHNYHDAVIKLDDDVGFHYKKHEFFKQVFDTDIELIFYKDIDTIITNLTMPIWSFIDSENDLFITKDMMGVNGGVLIIKNTECGRFVNDLILEQRGRFNNEQEVMDELMKDPQFNQYVKILPHPSINSYRYDLYQEFPEVRKPEQGMWHVGNFLLHTPALPFEQRESILRNAIITQ